MNLPTFFALSINHQYAMSSTDDTQPFSDSLANTSMHSPDSADDATSAVANTYKHEEPSQMVSLRRLNRYLESAVERVT